MLHNVFPCRKIDSLISALAEMIGVTGECNCQCPRLALDLSTQGAERIVTFKKDQLKLLKNRIQQSSLNIPSYFHTEHL